VSLAEDLKLDTLSGPAHALAEEACRIKARLDRLDQLIEGDEADWFGLRRDAAHEDVAEVTINRPLAEARQQALALRAVLAELRAVQGKVEPEAPSVDPADELAKARQAKRAAAGAP
jgi:hypothetical protein